jgi:quinol monooxygenase YgiN
LALLASTIAPSRALHGVIRFDVGRDIHVPEAAIVVAVFTDFAASKCHQSLAEVRQLRRILPRLVEAPPELQVFDVLAWRSFQSRPQ